MAKRVAIVGAGIIGCATAYHLSEQFNSSQCQITLISELFSPYTTSEKSSGAIIPFDVTDPPCSDSVEGQGDIRRWSRETIDRMRELYHSPDVAQIGVTYSYGCEAATGHKENPWWASLADGFRRLTDEKERKAFNIPKEYETAFFFGMHILDCRLYLPWLMDNFRKNGGIIKQQKITSLDELTGTYDIVINCTGLGASTLVPDDELFPVSGEAITVSAPWMKTFLALFNKKESSSMYVYPRSSDVLLGGTSKVNDWNDKSNIEVSQSKLQACREAVPGLQKARVMSNWVGLRPCRQKIRLTSEKISPSSTLIHCYGHGSKGISLHWGSALEIGRLVSNIVS